jgi:hypothetical protein
VVTDEGATRCEQRFQKYFGLPGEGE